MDEQLSFAGCVVLARAWNALFIHGAHDEETAAAREWISDFRLKETQNRSGCDYALASINAYFVIRIVDALFSDTDTDGLKGAKSANNSTLFHG